MKPDIDILIVQLRDGRATTRSEAARTLAEYPSALAKNDLIKCSRDPNDNVRYWATWALAQLGTEEALDIVANQLEDADAGVRMIAAKALAHHPHGRAAIHLLRVLDDSSDNVAYWASSALATLGDKVLPRLLTMLGSPTWHKRSAAARTIIRLGREALGGVRKTLKSGNKDAQYWSLYILGELRQREAAADLVPFLASPEPELVVRAAISLGQLGCRDTIPRLVGLLGHRDESVRLAAIEALANFGDYSVKVLTDLLASNSHMMKVSATASLAMVGDTALKHIFEKLRHESTDLRFWAIRALERFDNPAIIPVLVSLLDDDEFDIQLAAATALKNYEMSQQTAIGLISRLSSPNWRVRRALAESLSLQQHLPIALYSQGLKSKNEDIRFWTAWILGHYEGEGAVDLLLPCFSDESWPVRKRAAESIAMLGAAAAPALTARLARKNSDENSRYWASRALVGINSPELLPDLIGLLDDPDWSIRGNAEEALLRFGEEAVPALLNALRTKKSRVIRENVSHCLVKMESLNCENVATLFQFREPDLNYWTAWILGRRGPEVVPCLRHLIVEGEERVRYLALKAAAIVDSSELHELCIELLDDEYVSLRRIAAQILGDFKVVAAVEPLLRSLNNAAEDLRIVILQALGKIGQMQAFDALLEALDDERWDVKKEAVVALGQLGSEEAVEPLINLLEDKASLDIQPFVVRALSGLNDPSVLPALVKLLEPSKEEEVILAAVEALGRIGDAKTFEHLVPFLETSSWDIRRATLEAIGHLGNASNLEPIKNVIRSEDVLLRATAQRVLKQLLGEERWAEYVDLAVRRALVEPAEEHYRKAKELRAAGDRKNAAKEVRSAIRCHKRARYYTLLGTIHLEMRRLDLARSNLTKALQIEPEDPEALSKLATVKIMVNRPTEATQLLRKMLSLPTLARPFRELAERMLERVRGGA